MSTTVFGQYSIRNNWHIVFYSIEYIVLRRKQFNRSAENCITLYCSKISNDCDVCPHYAALFPKDTARQWMYGDRVFVNECHLYRCNQAYSDQFITCSTSNVFNLMMKWFVHIWIMSIQGYREARSPRGQLCHWTPFLRSNFSLSIFWKL